MNKIQAKLIAKIAQHIKDVPKVEVYHGVAFAFEVGGKIPGKCPCCFFSNGYRVGLISKEKAKLYIYATTLSSAMEISEKDAHDFLYLCGYKSQTGRTTYLAAKKLLKKYGYGELLK